MFRILESQAPAKQNATDTINVLSGRLQSATLLEDRRAAILGLRSFAKIYPASVASGALRNLISSLSKDVEDVDTTKVVLETLLMLFSPNGSSPEASDDIALWLADEFTQRQENITVLLDLLESHEFFSRLYSLQLISAISTARPQRTQECVHTAPLGISKLVAVLEDKREAIRSEGLLLLTALTPSSSDLQKLVAFENAFDRIFGIIDTEGSITHGGATVQDCLSLLANLLRLNVSNQSFFRETGWFKKFTTLLKEALQEQDSQDGVPEWAKPQRDKNLWGLLAVLRLFLTKGSIGTQANQSSFWHNGVLTQVLEIAFHKSIDLNIRAEALATSADLIRGNGTLQEGFGQLEVVSPHDVAKSHQTNGVTPKIAFPARVNVLQALLDLALVTSSPLQTFDVRLAATECIKAYIYEHTQIRLYFLRRAIEGHNSDIYEADNILTILIKAPDSRQPDPYRPWIASVLLFHLLYEEEDAKNIAMSVKDGNAENGEEVVTCIQALSGNMINSGRIGEDERVTIGYLMVLCGWLYEDHDAVNDFLGEGSNLQSIVQFVIQDDQSQILASGLCAFLLGIIYEFSTKDSPIPREMIHQILSTSLGREQYFDKITKLREHPSIRDYEVLPQCYDSSSPGSLPHVYFDRIFVEFMKDNFSRILRAIDRAPGIEVPVIANGIHKGISRELVDLLRAQVEDRSQAVQKLESDVLTVERKLAQEQADHRKTKESAEIELNRIKSINEGLQRNHNDEIVKINKKNHAAKSEAQRDHTAMLSSLQNEIQKINDENDLAASRIRARNDAEIEDLKSIIHRLESEISKINRDHVQDLQTAHEEYSMKFNRLESQLARAEDKRHDDEARATRFHQDLELTESARAKIQIELDDLLMVLGDLEEKRSRDKKRLRVLGEQISDAEEDDNASHEDGEDGVDETDREV